jgi:hypothetical protein
MFREKAWCFSVEILNGRVLETMDHAFIQTIPAD